MRRRSDSGREGADPSPSIAPTLSAPPGTALYVHLPHCIVKCTYCDFFSVAVAGTEANHADLARTVGGILREAQRRAPRAPSTVFFGGGTPSLLDEQELERLLVGLERLSGFRDSASEVTLECNPESLTLEKARLLRALGVTRLSIGFQSLDPKILALFGRPHSNGDSFRAFEAARAAGFERVSVDLIYAVPGQALQDWERDLERVLDLLPDHVSAYSLAFEEGTQLTADLARGRLTRLPEELELAFFERTRERIETHGLEAYEISNFSSKDQRCRHNENYWSNGTYVGLGPGAVSKLARTRFGNPRSIAAWQRSVEGEGESAGFAASWEETLPAIGQLAETWWLGLRTADGVRPEEARRRADFAGADPAEAEARALGERGLLIERDGAWTLSPRGLPVADAVSARFLDLAARAPRQAGALGGGIER